MLLSTTSSLEGQPIRHYLGLLHGETILGAISFATSWPQSGI
jgi:uncharacterized protein YbjQ (UPF0145 family)